MACSKRFFNPRSGLLFTHRDESRQLPVWQAVMIGRLLQVLGNLMNIFGNVRHGGIILPTHGQQKKGAIKAPFLKIIC
jgi:hypothetical protein